LHVLVVEDDRQLADLLERMLLEEGHTPLVCGSVQQADGAIARRPFDVVVLDWMLPDGDGMALCARWRSRRLDVPVLMLTARGELQDRVSGLRAGADDYLAKPFEVEELVARLEALHRRAANPWLFQAGPLELDRRTQTVKLDGARLELTAREYALIARLADCPGECVSRRTLFADVWNIAIDQGSGVIDVHVSRLRDKLGGHAWLIETVRGLGFRLRTKR
jgi:DNA-binding response OmpR family regulator